MELFDFGIPALDKALNLTATVLLLLALGMLLIRVILRLCDRAFDRSERLAPFRTYLRSTLRAVLYTLLALAVLGSIGVEITSFVALLSVAGLAVSLSLQNTLSNVAGGVMLLIAILGLASAVWSNLESVELIDEYTCKITLSQYFATFENSLTYTWILSDEDIEQYGDDFQSAERVINGSGPWKFVEWQDGQYARYTPNQNYWDPDAVSNIDTLNVWFVNQENAKVSGITSGNLDYTQSLRSDMVPMVENLEGVEVIEYTSDVMYYMQFDCAEDSIFSDPNARKAVAYALDVNTVLGLVGGGEKMNCMFLPSLLGYDESIEGYEYNPDLAREYLAQTDYNGEKLTLYTRNDLVAIDDVMAVFIQNLVDVGFNISTKICDSAEFVTIRQDPSAYDIFFVNLGAFDADPYTLYIIPRIVNDTHNSYYHNEELNNLIIDSYTTTDKTKREDELKQVARIVYDECGPVLGLYASNSYCVIREGLEGVLVTKGAGPYFRYASVDEAVWNK